MPNPTDNDIKVSRAIQELISDAFSHEDDPDKVCALPKHPLVENVAEMTGLNTVAVETSIANLINSHVLIKVGDAIAFGDE